MKIKTSPQLQYGFTLIELLVVLAIVVIISSVVGVQISNRNPDNDINAEASRLIKLSRLAEDKAILTGDPFGLAIQPPDAEPYWQYAWQRYRGGQWITAEPPFVTQPLPEQFALLLELEGQEIEFDVLELEENELPLPSIVFFPGGEITPFLMTLVNLEEPEQERKVTNLITGRVQELLDEDELLR